MYYVYIYIYIYVCTYIYICIWTYIILHVYTYMYTYLHISCISYRDIILYSYVVLFILCKVLVPTGLDFGDSPCVWYSEKDLVNEMNIYDYMNHLAISVLFNNGA